MADLGGIAGGLVLNIVYVVGIVVFAAALFFITRFIQKTTKKQKSFTIRAIIVDLNGIIDFDDLAFTKSSETGLLEMIFRFRKTDSIPPIPKQFIRNNKVLLLNYAPGHYCVIDTTRTILEISKGSIIPFNLGMKKYIISKQREFLNKVEDKKRKWELYAPWITLGVGIIAACILAAFLFYVGIKLDQENIAQRLNECRELLR